jgi:hypothetical protein
MAYSISKVTGWDFWLNCVCNFGLWVNVSGKLEVNCDGPCIFPFICELEHWSNL